MYEMTGTVKKIFDEQTFGSGFTKREFVVTSEADRYPQDIKFELVKDKIALLNPVAEGDKVKVFFDLRGREWKGSYFVNLNAWKLESLSAAPASGDEPPPDFQPPEEVFDEEPPF